MLHNITSYDDGIQRPTYKTQFGDPKFTFIKWSPYLAQWTVYVHVSDDRHTVLFINNQHDECPPDDEWYYQVLYSNAEGYRHSNSPPSLTNVTMKPCSPSVIITNSDSAHSRLD